MIPFQAGLPDVVSPDVMQKVYETMATPYKYGCVLKHDSGFTDCCTIFRQGEVWYMMYTAIDLAEERPGYDTYLARSQDLLHWETLGKALRRDDSGSWDSRQKDGGIAFVDVEFGGSYVLKQVDGKYWCTYIGGSGVGYEPDPLCMGMAWAEDPTDPEGWTCLPEPILRQDDPDARFFEDVTLFKSFALADETRSTGYPYVMFYNGKRKNKRECIGMAVSQDGTTWERYGDKPAVTNQDDPRNVISGDPQIIRLGNLWVMHYFIGQTESAFTGEADESNHFTAFDTFACSYDLIHWTRWEGPPLVQPDCPLDDVFAHKPHVIFHNGVVYHFYCATNSKGERFLALATSKDLTGSEG